MVTSMYSPSLESGISVQLLIPMQQNQKQKKNAQPQRSGKNASKGVAMKSGKDQTIQPPAAIGEILQSYFHVETLRNGKGHFRNAIRARGQDFLANVLKPSPITDDGAGKVLTEVYLNPSELGETRLSRFASLYEKFLFTDFKVKYAPAVGSATYGSLVIAADRDIADITPEKSESGLRKLLSFEGAKQTPCWCPVTMDVPLEQPDTGYFTSPNSVEDRLAYQGQIYAGTVLPVEVAAGTAIGTLWIEYDCLLFVPQLEDIEVRSIFRNSPVVPTAADALLPYAPVSGPTKVEAGEPVTFVNATASAPTTLNLEEGVYRFINTVAQNVAGTVQMNAPTLRAKEPAPASAPQPQTLLLQSFLAQAAGDKAGVEYLLNVPKGGGTLTQTMASVSGLATNAVSRVILDRIEGYLASEAFLNFYGGLPI